MCDGGGGVVGVVSFIGNLSTSGCELSVSHTDALPSCPELPVPIEWRLNDPSGFGAEKVSYAAANRTTNSWSSGPLPGHNCLGCHGF